MTAGKALDRDDEPMQDRVTVLRLRRWIGIIGTLLPFVLLIGVNIPASTWEWAGVWTWLESMSGSYYTHVGNIFVASMCAIGIFLLCYRNNPIDDRLSSAAGGLAIIAAIFPTKPKTDPGATLPVQTVIIGYIHLITAGLLFVLLAVICLTRFTRLDYGREDTPGKRKRNKIYQTCGWVIVAAITMCVTTFFIPDSVGKTVHPLFWSEALAVLAFGVAWLVKADFLILPEKVSKPSAPTDDTNAVLQPS